MLVWGSNSSILGYHFCTKIKFFKNLHMQITHQQLLFVMPIQNIIQTVQPTPTSFKMGQV